MLLAIDYSPFDNQERTAHEVSVRLFMPDVYNVKSEQKIKSVKVDGIVRELRFDILPHGFCFVDPKAEYFKRAARSTGVL